MATKILNLLHVTAAERADPEVMKRLEERAKRERLTITFTGPSAELAAAMAYRVGDDRPSISAGDNRAILDNLKAIASGRVAVSRLIRP